MSQLSHAQFPLRRHPNLLVDHRRSRSAAVAEPRGANGQAVTGSGGRLHFGMVADIKSEAPAGLNRNSHFDVTKAEREPEIEPDRLVNDLRREPISGIADFRHALRLRRIQSASKLPTP